nr:sigma-70 family RNA polymerase sigma factor [Micromonospora sp. DSM 115978]
MTQGEIDVARDLTALVREARAGDRQALDAVVAAHLPLIYNVIGRALNGHADVDDLVQETILQVMRGLPGLREPDRFRSWVVAIAYRQIQRHLRERRRSVLRLREATPELPDPAADFAERTVSELMLTGQRRELAEAARWLDVADRKLLALWWQEASGALTRTELAAVLRVTPQHAAVRVQRLRSRLDAARCVVRALRARPRCADLTGLLRGWNGVADPLWRKRLTRHTRDCARCVAHHSGLVAPEHLLLGVSVVPAPLALAAALRIGSEAVPPALAQAAVVAGQATPTGWLGHLQAILAHKTAAAATAVTVAAGGGFVYAVHESPAPTTEATITVVSPSTAVGGPAPGSPVPAAPAPSGSPAGGGPAATGVTTADIYVAPDGSDTADGSLDRPYATLGRAVEVVRPGQTIALRGGTYRPTEPVEIDTSGTAEQRIILSNYRAERPVIDAAGVPAEKWMVTHRGSYWTVQGLEVMNSRNHAYVCVSCRQNVFQRLSMHDNVRSGLTLRDPGTIGNQVLDSDFHRNYDPRDRGRSGVGLAIKFGSGEGNLVRGCRAFDNADSGFDVGHFEDAILLEGNWSYGNGVNRWNASDWQANADGFLFGGGSPAPAAAHVLRHNAAWDNVGHGFSDGGNPGAPRLERNTAFRNGGTGFNLPVSAALVSANAAVGNGTDATVGNEDARSSENTWDGGTWSESMFRSTDPTASRGPRRPDGGLPPPGGFLATGSGIGARLAG